MIQRPRRLRKNQLIRDMVAETKLSAEMFIYPYFIVPGKGVKHPIPSMPGMHHGSVDEVVTDVERGWTDGVSRLLLIGEGEEKCEHAGGAYDPRSVVPGALRQIRHGF